MSKSKRKRKEDEDDDARQERLLDQLKQCGRLPGAPPGHYHDTGEKQQRRKDRKNERNRLREVARSHNRGYEDD